MQIIKKRGIFIIMILYLIFSLCACKSDNKKGQLHDIQIEEDMIYENKANEIKSENLYDKDADGFVDGWY